MDVVAVIKTFTNSHEYREYDIQGSINLKVVVAIAVLDILVMLYSIITWMLYVSWTYTYRNCQCRPQAKLTSCLGNILKFVFVPYLYCIFGYKKHDKFWMEEGTGMDDEREVSRSIYAVRQVWALLALAIGPLFGIFTHTSYILVAWLTEPHKTSSVFVFSIALLLYVFVMFRSLYRARVRRSATSGNVCSRVVRFIESFFHCCIICCANYNCSCTRDLESVDIGEEYSNQQKVLVNRKSRIPQAQEMDIIFSKGSILATFITGVVFTVPLALTVLGFSYIPLPSLNLAYYLRNAVEIGLVIFAALATHKIFSLQEPGLNVLLQNFADTYETHSKSNMRLSDNLFEACSEIAGEVCQTLYKSNTHPMRHIPHVRLNPVNNRINVANEQDTK